MLNPLAQYRIDNKVSWETLGKICDLHVSQTAYLLKMTKEDMKGLKLDTVARIKKATGVDLLKFVMGKEKKIDETPAESQDVSTVPPLRAEMAEGQVTETVAE